MQPNNEDICRLIQDIWVTLLGVDLPPTPLEEPVASDGDYLTGCVQIMGAWEGAVALHCSAKLARLAAAVMLGSDEPAPDEIRDAVSELSNITGGNFKSLLPTPCEISLPSVVEGRDYRLSIPGTALVSQVFFEWQNEPLEVMVLMRDDGARKGIPAQATQNEASLASKLN